VWPLLFIGEATDPKKELPLVVWKRRLRGRVEPIGDHGRQPTECVPHPPGLLVGLDDYLPSVADPSVEQPPGRSGEPTGALEVISEL